MVKYLSTMEFTKVTDPQVFLRTLASMTPVRSSLELGTNWRFGATARIVSESDIIQIWDAGRASRWYPALKSIPSVPSTFLFSLDVARGAGPLAASRRWT